MSNVHEYLTYLVMSITLVQVLLHQTDYITSAHDMRISVGTGFKIILNLHWTNYIYCCYISCQTQTFC